MAELTRDELLQKVRRGERIERADLRGIDLSKTRLKKAAFDRSDLDGANLEAADLSESTFKRASLREAFLVGANLASANLENADLEGANLERANLAGANLTRANLEGAVLTGADLTGAVLSYAQLTSANLGGATLADAVFTHAELDEAYLGAARADGASFANAMMRNANLEEAQLNGARFDDAMLAGADAHGASMAGASLVKADLSGANLCDTDLTDVDARQAKVEGAQLRGACLTAAKVAGLIGTGTPLEDIEVAWVDTSVDGSGARRIENGEIPGILTGIRPETEVDAAPRRYFGRGDVLRNATLQFDSSARVEIDSLFENCTINLGDGTELVVGAAGVLADCEITGAGNITVHGKFFERQSPGIVGPRRLVVSSGGAVVSSVAQNDELTRFAFERGCQLRVKILKGKSETAGNDKEARA